MINQEFKKIDKNEKSREFDAFAIDLTSALIHLRSEDKLRGRDQCDILIMADITGAVKNQEN